MGQGNHPHYNTPVKIYPYFETPRKITYFYNYHKNCTRYPQLVVRKYSIHVDYIISHKSCYFHVTCMTT